MGTAMIRGWLDHGISHCTRICASDRPSHNTQLLTSIGLATYPEAGDGGAENIAHCADIIFLGVKPQCMKEVLGALAPHVRSHHLIVSIAAGEGGVARSG